MAPHIERTDKVICRGLFVPKILLVNIQMARNYAPPEALQKRLDALESPGGPPVIVYTENRKMASLRFD